MDLAILFEIYSRDLEALKKEIQGYSDESLMWRTDKQITNSAGNLCLHLLGNLNHFIGNVLGKSGYIRNREAEFTQKNVAAADLIASIEATIIQIKSVFSSLSQEDLLKEYPLEIAGKRASTEFWLMHFACHLNYHLGQINYHRRLLTN